MTTVGQVGLIGAEDLVHLQFAASTGHVLVTQDADFLRLPEEGVAHAALLPEEMTNSVEFL